MKREHGGRFATNPETPATATAAPPPATAAQTELDPVTPSVVAGPPSPAPAAGVTILEEKRGPGRPRKLKPDEAAELSARTAQAVARRAVPVAPVAPVELASPAEAARYTQRIARAVRNILNLHEESDACADLRLISGEVAGELSIARRGIYWIASLVLAAVGFFCVWLRSRKERKDANALKGQRIDADRERARQESRDLRLILGQGSAGEASP